MSEESLEASHGQTKIRLQGQNAMTIAVIVFLAVMSAIFWRHQEETASNNTIQAATLREIAATQKEMAREQRFSTCVNATKEADREAQYSSPSSFCNRVAR